MMSLAASTGAAKPHWLVPDRPHQPTSPQVSWPSWPMVGTFWNSQSFLPVFTSKARELPGTPSGFSRVAAPISMTPLAMVGVPP